MEATHTPGPWCKAISSLRATAKTFIIGNDESVSPICEVLGESDVKEANSRFIVQACNAHTVWVEEFKNIQIYVVAWEEGMIDEQDLLDKFFELYRTLRQLVALGE